MSALGLQRPPLCYDQIEAGCWVACIAGITMLSIDDLNAFVPRGLRHLVTARNAEDDEAHRDALEMQVRDLWNEYHNNVNAYMRERGWRLAYLGPDCPAGYAMAYGPGPRGVDHAIIVYNGKLWHDPHPSRAGLNGVTAYEACIPLVNA
jgi:hypothetical protein